MTLVRSVTLTLIVALALGGLGVWAGAEYVTHRANRVSSLHEVLHKRLKLDSAQELRIAQMEAEHARQRRALEAEMRAANVDLAKAFEQQHAYTAEVKAAIERFHHAMGELQKETIEHTLAMRSVLTPAQAQEFDATVVQSLTDATR